MKILTLNCGSSSLKFAGFDIDSNHANARFNDRVELGQGAKFSFQTRDKNETEAVEVSNHKEATRMVFDRLRGFFEPEAIGHRIVHGGTSFNRPVLIDKRVLKTLDGIPFAPLHNGPALEVVRASRLFSGDSAPMVATFDTAFHFTLPAHARRYAIPQEFTVKHGLWRFGFHGLAYRSMVEHYFADTGAKREGSKVIALQLGSGCSAAAILNGQSIETSMGLTPLEGLMMATRCGDLDPSLPDTLARAEGVDAQEVGAWLNKQSGLLGVSGASSKVDALLELEKQGDEKAHLALEMYCHRIRKYIGAYLAILGGADAILFGGGVGENSPSIRSRICKHMEWCGLSLDETRNSKGTEDRISSDASNLKAYVIAVNEEEIIARDTFECVTAHQKG